MMMMKLQQYQKQIYTTSIGMTDRNGSCGATHRHHSKSQNSNHRRTDTRNRTWSVTYNSSSGESHTMITTTSPTTSTTTTIVFDGSNYLNTNKIHEYCCCWWYRLPKIFTTSLLMNTLCMLSFAYLLLFNNTNNTSNNHWIRFRSSTTTSFYVSMTTTVVSASSTDIDIELIPSIESILYDEGYIRGHGHVDLSYLFFEALTEPYLGFDGAEDDYMNNGGDDDDDADLNYMDDDNMKNDDELGPYNGDGTTDVVDDDDELGGSDRRMTLIRHHHHNYRYHKQRQLVRNENKKQHPQQQSQLSINKMNSSNTNDTEISLVLQQQQRGLTLPQQQQQQQRQLLQQFEDGGIDHDAIFIDIAILPIPRRCVRNKRNCHWNQLGVGKAYTPTTTDTDIDTANTNSKQKKAKSNNNMNSIRWCCDTIAIEHGLCTQANYGRLLYDETKFGINSNNNQNNNYYKRSISISRIGYVRKTISQPIVNVTKTSMYTVIFANCHAEPIQESRTISITGRIIWKSQHGYLPGNLYPFMYLYIVQTICFAIVLVWYVCCMFFHRTTRIDMEYYIVVVLVLSFIEMTSRSLDYIIWNRSSVRSTFVLWMCIVSGIIKQSFSYCISVLVSMGYGINPTVVISKNALCRVGTLGFLFIGTALCYDSMVVYTTNHISVLQPNTSTMMINAITLLIYLEYLVHICFIGLILLSLQSTIDYFHNTNTNNNNNNTKKLIRMKQLRTIFIVSSVFIVLMTIIAMIDDYLYNKGQQEHDEQKVDETFSDDNNDTPSFHTEEWTWIKDIVYEMNYAFVLIGIAMLWKPNKYAREYGSYKKHEDDVTTTTSSSSSKATITNGNDNDHDIDDIDNIETKGLIEFSTMNKQQQQQQRFNNTNNSTTSTTPIIHNRSGIATTTSSNKKVKD